MPLVVLAPQHNQEDFSLDASVIEDLWAMEERHFWHRARNEWIVKALAASDVRPPARVLEVGCGSGAVTGALAAAGYDLVGVDTAEPLVRKANDRFPGVTFFAADVASLPMDVGRFAALGFFDVLEHLGSPEDLLRAALPRLEPNGVVLATVPALRSLHTVIDDLSGHKKRYERGELRDVFASVGIHDVVERGIFRWTLPMQKAARARFGEAASPLDFDARRALMKKNFVVPAWPLNRALESLCALERRFGFAASIDEPGATLLVVGRYRP